DGAIGRHVDFIEGPHGETGGAAIGGQAGRRMQLSVAPCGANVNPEAVGRIDLRAELKFRRVDRIKFAVVSHAVGGGRPAAVDVAPVAAEIETKIRTQRAVWRL